MIVIGIDPGTSIVWYAIVEKNWNEKKLLDYGIIETTPKIPIIDKILEISSDLEALIKQYNPERVVIEKLFFNTNITTGIDVSQVRGVILYQFAKRGIEILEYTPLELKSAICGNGKADKKQLQTAIKIFFWLDSIPKPDDAADAIWLAYMGVLQR